MNTAIRPPKFNYCPLCGTRLGSKRDEEGIIRANCPADNWTYYPHPHIASCALILNKDDQVLLVKRAREPKKGLWSFPAGFIDFGELPRTALIREVSEETGLKVIWAKLKWIQIVNDDPRSAGILSFIFQTRASDGKLLNGDRHENSELGWFNLSGLPPIAWEGHRRVLQSISKRVR